MTKATFYIEHLIVGTFALVAFGLTTDVRLLENKDALTLLTLIPLAYVAGLVIEALGVGLEEAVRFALDDGPRIPAIISSLFRKEPKQLPESTYTRTLTILVWNADVGEELKLRRSRDRVARGALLVTFSLWIYFSVSGSGVRFDELSVTASSTRCWTLALLVTLAVTWFCLHVSTRIFKRVAYEAATRNRRIIRKGQTPSEPEGGGGGEPEADV